MKTKNKSRTYLVTVKVVSKDGTRPIVRTLGGDTIFVNLSEGMKGSWVLKRKTKPRKKPAPPQFSVASYFTKCSKCGFSLDNHRFLACKGYT